MNLYATRDNVANEFMNPFPARNHGIAIRIHKISLARDEYARNNLHEFELWDIGEWDNTTGKIVANGDHPIRVQVNLDIDEDEGESDG